MSSWIFLRGLTREARHWGRFPQAFEAAVCGAAVAALDLPGNGQLFERRSPTTAQAMAEYCRAELAQRGVAPPHYLLGLSFGAMVATAWAARHPNEVMGCVLIGTSLGSFSPFYHRLRPPNYQLLLRLAFRRGDVERNERAILDLTSNCRNARAEVLPDWIAYRHQYPVSAPNAMRQLVAALRFRAPRFAPVARILVLCGGADRLVDPRCSQRLAQRWEVPLAIQPQAGHDLTLDDPNWAIQKIQAWLIRGDSCSATASA